MDGLAHLLWTFALIRIANTKMKKKLNIWITMFFGAFPDILAFGIPLILFIASFAFKGINVFDILPQVRMLYNVGHSLFAFLAAFLIISLVLRRPVLELCSWGVHILIDIPTHSFKFYPTPFLWPFSAYRFNGISWSDPRFLIFNYVALAVVYFILLKTDLIKKRRR